MSSSRCASAAAWGRPACLRSPEMPVDPQIQMLLDLGAGLPELHTLSVEDARAQFAARDFAGLRKPEVANVVNRDMQGPGGSLGLRIYTPLGNGPFPLMVFFHGS